MVNPSRTMFVRVSGKKYFTKRSFKKKVRQDPSTKQIMRLRQQTCFPALMSCSCQSSKPLMRFFQNVLYLFLYSSIHNTNFLHWGLTSSGEDKRGIKCWHLVQLPATKNSVVLNKDTPRFWHILRVDMPGVSCF